MRQPILAPALVKTLELGVEDATVGGQRGRREERGERKEDSGCQSTDAGGPAEECGFHLVAGGEGLMAQDLKRLPGIFDRN